uniref:Uncharacterized protein n=1 Tax=Cyprinus carpio TaxID=7962 RepID=A0A8C2DTL2_CYPCA
MITFLLQSVKSVKPFKTKKMRGGRFGLQRLKENKKARARTELDVEVLPGKSDLSPVDVEFVFPKFKMRKGGKATADGSGHLEGIITNTKKKRKIRFPKMKAMDASVGEGNLNVDVSAHEGEASRAKLKDKTKGPKFGMNLPKIKKSKLDVQSSNDSFEVKELEGKFKPPSVECDFNIPQSKAETNVPNLEVCAKGKGECPEIKMPKINPDVSDAKGTVTKFKLPKARLSCHSDEIDGEARKETDTSENKLKMLKIDIKAPKVDLDLHLPKSKGTAEFKDAEVPDCNVRGTKINTAKPDTSLPVLNLHAKQKFGDDIDGSMVKEHKISLPKPDIAVPKIETSGLPTLDVSLPKPTAGNIDTEGHASTEVKYEITKLNISLPKITSPEGEVVVEEPGAKGGTFHKPNISILLPKGKGEAKVDSHSEKEPNVKMPQIDIFLPKMKLPQGKIDIEGSEVDISLPKGMLEAGADVEGHFGKGEKIKMPKVDVSLPNVKSPEHAIAEGPDIKAGKLSMPSTEISIPKGKTEGNIEIGEPSGKGGKSKKPHLDVLMPKMKLSTGAINTEDPEVKGEKFQMPPTDILLSKGKIEASVEVEGHSGKANMPKIDLNMSLPESKLDSLSPDVGKFSIPGADISLPKGKTDEQIHLEVEKRDKFQIPESDTSLPKFKSREVDFDVKRTNRKFHMPATDISLPHKKDERDVNVEPSDKCGKIEMPKVDISLPAVKASGIEISLPKMKSPQCDISTEGPDSKSFNMPSVDVSFPKVTDTGDVDLKGHSGKIGKFDIPKLDISLPKFESTKGELSLEGPEFKGGELNIPSYNISAAEVKTEHDVCLEGKTKKGTKFQMPKLNINLPQIKSAGTEMNIDGPELKGGKIDIPDADISLPQGKVKGDGKVNVSKGGKFHLPHIDLSLPKIKKRSVEVNVDGPDVKGSKVHTPSLDISLPKNETEKNTDIEGHSGTGKTFEMPKTDVSLPKVKATEGGIGAEAPQIQGGKLDMPSTEMSFPKGKVTGNIDLDGKKTNLPKFVISSPKTKSSDGEINIDIKDGKINMPSIDTSLPGGGAAGDVNVEGHAGKRKKFEMPKFHVSLPKLKPSRGEINIEGPDIKGGKINMPSIDTSLSGGAGGDVNVVGHAGKGRKFEMQTFDVYLPKLKPSGGEINVEGADIKGGKIHMPSIDISLPSGGAGVDLDVEGHGRKGRKFGMPKLDVSLPKLKPSGGEINVEGPDIKGGKIHMPSIDISLPGGGARGDVDAEGHAEKGGKNEMPKFDVSLAKLKPSGGEMNTEGHHIKGGKINMPSIDTSLPGGGAGGDVNVEGHEGKGKKFEMPKFHVSLPKLKPSGGEINVEGPDIKGGKINMPSIDTSLPGGGAGGEVNVKGHAGKGRKFEMPTFDVSLAKSKPSGGDINVEGPDIKGGNIHMPSIDISLPGGGAGGDVDAKGHAGKGRKFEIPKFDVSLPKLKSSGGEINIEAYHIKGGKINMPSIDSSLPEGGAGGDVNVEGHAGKGRKFEIPTFDVSLPKLKPSEGEINVEGLEIKGGKIHMPSIDTSLPGGGAGGDVDIEAHTGKGRRFQMPKLDVSLPKLKPSGGEIHVECSDIKGGKINMPSIDISLPGGGAGGDVDVEGHGRKGKKFEMPKLKPSGGEIDVEGPDIKGGNFHMPSIDISLQGGEAGGDVDIERHAGKGKKFEMPKLDVSLPKLKPSGGELNVEGPHINSGKFHMPSIDISMPVGGAGGDVDVEGHTRRGRKIEMPKLDVSLPKLKPSEGEINVEGPDIKGGKFHMPSIDTSLPGAKEGELDLGDDTKKGLRFQMPTVPMPKMKLTDHELKVGSDKKDIDISVPKLTHDSDGETKATGVKIRDLNVPEVTLGGNIKLPSVKIPTVDISAPKVDLDFTLSKGKGNDRENIELLKAEGGRPSSGASFDVPDVSKKMPKISLPKFGRKLKSGDKQLDSPDLPLDLDLERTSPSVETSKKDTEIIGTDAEMKIKAGAGEITKPEIRVEGPDVKVKSKLKFPKFKTPTPKAKLKDVEMGMPGYVDNKGKVRMPAVEISLPTANIPECEVLLPKTEVDVSEADIRGYEGSLKIPKMPTIDISVPKADLDVSLPRLKLHEPVDSSDLQINSSRGTVNFPHVKIPEVDISLPHGKTGDTDNNEVEISLPDAKHDTSNADTEIKGKKLKISVPSLDISLPHGKTTQNDDPDLEFGLKGSKLKMPDITVPKIDVSLPHRSKEESHAPDLALEGGKLKMPTTDMSLPKIKSKDVVPELQPDVGKGKVMIPGIKLPTIDVSFPHGKTEDTDDLELGVCGKEGKFKVPDTKIPKADVSSQGQPESAEKTEVRGQGSNFQLPKITIPKVDISLPYGKSDDPQTSGSVEVEGGQSKMPDIKIPQVAISLLESRTGEFDTKEGESGGGRGKFTMSNIKIPKLDIRMSSDADMSDPSTDASLKDSHKEGKKLRMPNLDLELDLGFSRDRKKNKKKNEHSDTDLELAAPKEKIKGPKVKGSKFNIGMPKVKVSRLETNINKSGKTDAKFLKGGTDANLQADLQAPKIPELDFDIETARSDTNNSEEDKKQIGKVKIPKFGVPLPSLSSPEANIKSSQGKDHSINIDSEAENESPHVPRVKKAVFVMVNPQMENTASIDGEASAEIVDEKLKQPKIKMKPSFGKSRSIEKEKAIYCEDEVETEGKSKTGKLKLPKVTFSSGQRGSSDVTPSGSDDGTGLSLNGGKDEKSMFGKLKMPKVEFFSPYSKDASEEEEMETSLKLRKEPSGESKESKVEVRKISTIVSSKARTEMLAEREGSESPVPTVSAGFVSVTKSEEREETTWFKVPKVTLSPHKIPEVDISLPHGKTGDTDNNEVEISLPDAKHDTSNADTEIKGKKLKISVPSLDISLPHGKTTQNDDPDLEFGLKGSKLKMPDITVPKIDVSLPHRSKEESHAPDLALEGGKLKMPTTDMSLPKIKSKDVVPELQPDVGKGKVMIPGIKLPTIDVSFPHGKTEDTDDLELGVCGKEGKFKVPDTKIPKADVSSQGQPESAEKTEVRGQGSNFQLPKITIPKVDISLPYGKSDDPQTSGSVEVEGGQSKMPDIKIPQVAISLLESRTGEFDTKEGESGGGRGKFTMSNIKIPKLDIRMSSDADMSDPSTDASLKDSHKEGKKLRMPNLDLELDLGFSRDRKKNKKKNEHSDTDLELAAPKEKIKGPKVKGSKFNIGMPKVKVSRLETNINKSGKTDAKFLKGGTDANLQADLQAPKIPELDFDIETARSDTNNSKEDKKQIGKVKIPKFGVPLPSLSSPEANIKSSQGKDHSINIDSEAENESPHVPRVKKAVFVMVNPQMENTASIDGEASAEIVDEKLKQPKIKMKPSFGKSRSIEKEKAIYCEDEVETEGKSKTGKLKLPKVTFSSGQRGSSDVTPSGSDDGTGLSLNGGKDEKSMFGKLKLPKVEFFSPYSKDASEEEEMETSLKLRKEPSGESKESKVEVRKISTIVSSKARTEMLAEREGSESPVPTVSAGFVSVTKSEEREETTWFKVPKVTLSPHSTGILNISPESSPKGSKSSLPCTSEEASGGFYVKMPSVEFLTREMPSEHLITKKEGTLTVVTKTTKYTETKSTSSKE